MFYLMMRSTHFNYGYMASEIIVKCIFLFYLIQKRKFPKFIPANCQSSQSSIIIIINRNIMIIVIIIIAKIS